MPFSVYIYFSQKYTYAFFFFNIIISRGEELGFQNGLPNILIIVSRCAAGVLENLESASSVQIPGLPVNMRTNAITNRMNPSLYLWIKYQCILGSTDSCQTRLRERTPSITKIRGEVYE